MRTTADCYIETSSRPTSFWTTPHRGRRRVLLGDFGIARTAADISGLTETNVTLGTVNYAAPEQLMGGEIDGRADQYALAATAFHLLTGTPMYGSSNPAVVISRHLNAPPPTLGTSHPGLAALDSVLAKALSKNPDGRFHSCTDFAQALTQAVTSTTAVPQVQPSASPPFHNPPTAVLPTPLEPAPPPTPVAARASRWPWLVAAVAVLLIVGAVVVAVWPGSQSGPRVASNATTTTSSPSPVVPGAVTFDSMRTLVTEFYRQLPGDARAAWSDLDTHYQQRNGLDDFLAFWSSIQSVRLISVSPRDATSVVARLSYLRRDGVVDTEDRWLSVVAEDGRLLIYDSERIGPA